MHPNLWRNWHSLGILYHYKNYVLSIMYHYYEERRQRLGLHSLQRPRLRADLITAFKMFKDLLDIHPTLFSFLPLDVA